MMTEEIVDVVVDVVAGVSCLGPSGLCGAGADVAVECEVPAAGAGGGEA